MYAKNWKKEIWSIPNLLSLFRILLIPVYMSIYLNAEGTKDYATAGVILAASCLTDLADGQIARRFNMITNLGKVLDPLADKLTQLSLFLCLSSRHRMLKYLLVIFLIKEFWQLFVMITTLRRGKALSGALMSGKICTTVLFVSLILMVMLPQLPYQTITIIAAIDILFLLISFIDYLCTYLFSQKRFQSLEENK